MATDGTELFYDSFHDCIRKRVWGTLAKDREKMLKQLDKWIEEFEKKESIYATDFSYKNCPAQTMFDCEKRSKLIIYINPPYKEAGDAKQKAGTGKNISG